MMQLGAPSTEFRFPVLIADLGGTNLRLGLLAGPGKDIQTLGRLRTADFDSLDAALAHIVAEAGIVAPKTLIAAIAGPVGLAKMRLTNHPWDIVPERLATHLDLDEVIVVNDFTAQALALPELGAADLHPIGGGAPAPDAAKVVLGPGTGLGVAALVPSRCGWLPVSGEGGHVALTPETTTERAIWPYLEAPDGRVSAETVISGPGLLRLYQAVARAGGGTASCATPQAVTEAAGAGDPLARQTLDLFAHAFGRFAGDVALTFLARGGVYLSGGIAPQIRPWLETGVFRAAFDAKAPYVAIMGDIPIFIVTADEPALHGLAALVRDPSRSAIDLDRFRFRR